MATRKNIQHSQMGIAESNAANSREHEITQLALSNVPQAPEQLFTIFKLVNNKRKGRVYIDGIDDVINPKTGKTERMRLISGVAEIWMSEQKNIPEDFIKKNRRSLQFEGKICRIPHTDTSALEFAKLCRHFIDAPNRRSGSKHEFFEWNPARQAEAALKKRQLKVDAMKIALTIDEDKMRKHALYLGVGFSDELGLPKESDAIRNDYVLKAEDAPEKFMETVDSPIVTISFLVKKAIRDAKIDLGRSLNNAYWSAGGRFIAKIPMSRKAHEYLIELAMTNSDEGKIFLEELQNVTK